MPKTIQILVIIAWRLASLAGRDNRGDSGTLKSFNKCIAVIPLVTQQIFGIYVFDKSASLRAVSNGTCCNKHSDRHTMRIHGQMYLGVEPPFVRAIS